ncbi:3'(2'),5'-bisphosphate nucleotidase CysQ [Granulosicoccus antarcticus]|uniref:3'(2'),5'-bisphosphate nucleotidase CysQ n=1 Tax=Granulosicoccus antarcticus IMCC3135 TaxID=1192854 RepID=A0A2Z2P1G1_9GAMM|nr:3'(2'),5'-bisphosphate nucleotidase CysQ [Granulosicoccus antarcticus]ASJ76645.1 3'(2'),5'-bisphosphate nucleotidase CysQ [Granulosicoccus antarcticus IMCC3135]
MSIALEIADRLTHEALAIARQAGTRIVEVYKGENCEVAYKSDETPVTTADLAAHHIILHELQQLMPCLPVLSEESDGISFEERHGWPAYWLVDPLDGTREFLRRNGEFSVNIALVVGNRPIAGVIVAPVLDIAYFATQGVGAFKQIGSSEPQPIHVRSAPSKITVARSRCPTTGPRLQQFLNGIGKHDEIPMGSALKSCLVAEGAADIYARLGPTGEWDTAAAQCIVEEAGGYIRDMRSRDLTYNMRESLINPQFLVYGDDQIDWNKHVPPEAQKA